MYAQGTKTVTGTVTDENGEQLIGVSVIATGTSSGGVTDVNGFFQFSVPQSVTNLNLKYLGMKDLTVPIQSGSMRIMMTAENQIIDEVIVVAYGTVKRSDFTGAAATLGQRELSKRPLTNVSSAIEGNVSGVQTTSSLGQPGESASLRIRGFGSVNASNAPLYVVDGAIYNGSVSSLNPNDIETITVLKDGASTALYGSSAGNGVVLITTKKGTKMNQAEVNLVVRQGWSERAFADYKRVGVYDYFPLQWQMRKNAYITSGLTPEAAAQKASAEMVSTLKYNPFVGVADDAIVGVDGLLNPNANQLKWGDDLDWEDAAYGKGHRQEYNLSFNSKSEKTSTFASVNYTKDQGYMLKTDLERYSGRLNYTITPVKWFASGLNLSIARSLSNYSTSNSDSNSSYSNLSRFVRVMAPIYPVHKHDLETGAYLDEYGNATTDPSKYMYDYAGARLSSAGRDAIAETTMNMRNYSRFATNGRGFVTLKPVEGLEMTANYALENTDYRRKVYENTEVGDGAPAGRFNNMSTRSLTQTLNQLVNYKKSFDLHNIDVLVGHESFAYKYEYLYAMKTDEIIKDIYDFPNFVNTSSLNSYTDTYNKEGYLARINYDYDHRYYLSASYRKDGSSRFSKENRWGDFYSIGASWRINNEAFLNEIEWLNNLKLRASYGETGSDAVLRNSSDSYYPYQTFYDLGENNSTEAGAYFLNVSNRDLKWETQVTYDVAVEFGIFKKLSGTIEWFTKASKDLLFDVNSPTSTGVSSVTRNIGRVENKGLEVGLRYDFLNTKDWKAYVGLNATYLKNKITRLPDDMKENGKISDSKKLMEGYSMYDFWLRQWYGVNPDNGDGLFYLDTEAYNEDDKTLTTAVKNTVVEIDGKQLTNSYNYAKFDWSGSSIPDIYGGFSLGGSYKSFSIDAVFSYALGHKILDYNNYGALMGYSTYGHALHEDTKLAWKNPGDITNVPRMDFTSAYNTNISTSYSTRWLRDGDFLNFRSLVISYSLPKNLINKADLKNVEISLSGENLFLLKSIQGMNPQGYYSGLNYNDYTTARTFSVNLNLSF
jgi:TonB-linked SusC/RagA family outer membrane protein